MLVLVIGFHSRHVLTEVEGQNGVVRKMAAADVVEGRHQTNEYSGGSPLGVPDVKIGPPLPGVSGGVWSPV